MVEHRTSPRRLDVAARRARALELRRAGVRYADIAAWLGYRSRSAACQDVTRALDGIIREPGEEVLAAELDRLDRMLTGLWPAARSGDVQAVDRVLRIMDRRARYLGLDKLHVAVTSETPWDAMVSAIVAADPEAGLVVPHEPAGDDLDADAGS